jgi:hypothetical protein
MLCPGCKTPLEPCGDVSIDADQTAIVYQCDRCVRPWVVGDQTFQVALTFAVTPTGELIDPETLAPLSLN